MTIMKKKNIIYSLLILCVIYTNAQDYNSTNDFVSKLLKSYEENKLEKPDSAFAYLKKALKIKNISTKDKIHIFDRIGEYYSCKKKTDSALYYHKKANKIAVKESFYREMAATSMNIGVEYLNNGEYDKALIEYFKAEKYFKNKSNPKDLSIVYENIALVFQVLKKSEKAIQFHLKSINLIDKNKETRLVSTIYGNISNCFIHLKEIDSSRYYNKLAYKGFQKIGDINNLALTENNIGYSYFLEKKYEKAKKKYLKAIDLFKEINYKNRLITPYINLGDLFSENLNKPIQAEKYYLKAEKICIEINNQMNLDELYLNLATFYKKYKKYKLSSEYFDKYIEIHNKINSEKRDAALNKLITKYELREKQQKIDLLAKENINKKQKIRISNYIIILLSLVMTLIIFIAYLIKQKSDQKKIQIEQELQQYLLQIKEHTTPIDLDKFRTKFGLSTRELEILILLSKGHSYSSIGENIYISKNTVKYHLKNIYVKLDVKNKIEALNLMKY